MSSSPLASQLGVPEVALVLPAPHRKVGDVPHLGGGAGEGERGGGVGGGGGGGGGGEALTWTPSGSWRSTCSPWKVLSSAGARWSE